MRIRRLPFGMALGASMLLALGAARPARAIDRDVKAVLVVASYGAVGGTVLGLAALPFNRNVRTVFIGTSLGLYLGIMVGLYYVFDRQDRENAMRMRPGDRMSDRGGVERDLREVALARAPSPLESSPEAQPLRLDVPVLRF